MWPAPDNSSEQQTPNDMEKQLQLKRLLSKFVIHFSPAHGHSNLCIFIPQHINVISFQA